MKTGLWGKSKKKKKSGVRRTAKRTAGMERGPNPEHPQCGPELRMQKTPKIRWEVEMGRGSSHWKSAEELAARARKGELCNARGSGSLRAWLLDTRKEPPLGGQGGSAASVRGQGWESGLQRELQGPVGTQGGGQGWRARRGAGGGVWAD